MKRNNAFGHFEILAVFAVVTLVSFLGYTAFIRYEGQMAKETTADTTVAKVEKVDDITVESAPEINETADLASADNTLESINIDSMSDDGDLADFEAAMN